MINRGAGYGVELPCKELIHLQLAQLRQVKGRKMYVVYIDGLNPNPILRGCPKVGPLTPGGLTVIRTDVDLFNDNNTLFKYN